MFAPVVDGRTEDTEFCKPLNQYSKRAQKVKEM